MKIGAEPPDIDYSQKVNLTFSTFVVRGYGYFLRFRHLVLDCIAGAGARTGSKIEFFK